MYFSVPGESYDSEIIVWETHHLDLCKLFNVHIVNGRTKSYTSCQLTCISYMGINTADYFLGSSQLFQKGVDLRMRHRVESDHMPLLCTLSTVHSDILVPKSSINLTTVPRYRLSEPASYTNRELHLMHWTTFLLCYRLA